MAEYGILKWSDIVANWSDHLAGLTARFPRAKPDYLSLHKERIEDVASYLADAHELTLMEAHEEIEHYVLVQTLAREAPDIRAHDAALFAAE